MSDEGLETAFERQIRADCQEARRACRYDARVWLQMIGEHGAVEAAKRLLQASEAAAGFTRLWECRRLDLTVEYQATRPRWQPLFTAAEIAVARDRLRQLGFQDA